ncbi:MAG: undecaprenyl-phosphate glucose phosphotransferase [Gemmatimonas sp.]
MNAEPKKSGSPRPSASGDGRPRSLLTPEIISETTKIVDFAVIVFAALIAFSGYLGYIGSEEQLDRYGLTGALGAIVFVVGFDRAGGYRFERLSSTRWQITRVALAWFATLSVLLLLAYIAKVSQAYSRGWTMAWTMVSLGSLVALRVALNVAIGYWSHLGYLARRVVIVGAGEIGERLLGRLATAENAVSVVGVFDDRKTRIAPTVCGHRVLGTTDDLLRFARDTEVDEIILALPLGAEHRLEELVEKLRLLPVDLRVSAVPVVSTMLIRGLSHVGGVPMLEIIDRPLKQWSAVAKWLEDKIIGLGLLILFAPLMALIAVAIRVDSRGPVLFAQRRFGFNNRPIEVLKFRTMYIDAGDPTGQMRTVRDDPRVTRIGRLLREMSLDELPQLLNVLRGDMSLVGPRPHAVAMKAGDRLYHEAVEEYLHRHKVKPGITGWAQVHGLRGEVDTLEKANLRLAYDLDYIERWSLWLDLEILLRSIPILLRRINAY